MLSKIVRKITEEETNPRYGLGLRFLVAQMLRERRFLLFVILTGLISAFFEGGSIGLLAIAANIIMNGTDSFFLTLGKFDLFDISHFISWLANKKTEWLFVMLVIIAIIFQVFKSAITYVNTVFSIKIRRKVAIGLQKSITADILDIDYLDAIKISIGDLQERIRLGDLVSKIVTTFTTAFLAICMLIIYASLMFTISFELTLLAIMFLAILTGLIKIIVIKLKRYGSDATSAMLKMGTVTVDLLSAQRLIRVLNIRQHVKDRIQQERYQYQIAGEKISILNGLISPAIDMLVVIGAGLFFLGVFSYFQDEFRGMLADAIIFLIILNRMMPQVQNLNKSRLAFASHYKSLEEIGRLISLTKTRRKIKDPENTREFSRSITMKNISFSYSNSNPMILEGLQVNINHGEFITIIGGSGSGKSTIVDLLLGLIEPISGEILVDDIDLKKFGLKNWRKQIGLVEQNIVILNDSISNNVIFGRGNYPKDQIMRAIDLASARQYVDGLSLGLETRIGENGVQLSGGEVQRIGIARAILDKPKLLILDEASSALDRSTALNIDKNLRELGRSMTTIKISHDLSSILPDDRVILLEEGKIAADTNFGSIQSMGLGHIYKVNK